MIRRESIKFSVIIPTYNSEKFVGRCLESIINQTYNCFEIIVVDDGSIDSTVLVVEEMTSEIPIHCVRELHKGVSNARNIGLEKAKGDYIIFVDSDDQLNPEALEKCFQIIKEHQVDAVFYESTVDESSGVPIANKKYAEGRPKHFYGEIIDGKRLFVESILSGKYLVSPVLYAVSSKIIKQYKFPENMYYEDSVFTTRLLLSNEMNRILCTKDKLYKRWTRAGSITSEPKNIYHYKSYNKAICHISDDIIKLPNCSERVCLITLRKMIITCSNNCALTFNINFFHRAIHFFTIVRLKYLKFKFFVCITTLFPALLKAFDKQNELLENK